MALPVHTGKVQHVSRSHGFLEWQVGGENQPRIFYQAFDVEGNVELSKGDEVTFTIADKVRASLRACLTRIATLPEQAQPVLPERQVSSEGVSRYALCVTLQSMPGLRICIYVYMCQFWLCCCGPCAAFLAKAVSSLLANLDV